jgi:hypothetical protein
MLLALLWFTLGVGAGFIICACLVSGSQEELQKAAWQAGYEYRKNRENI